MNPAARFRYAVVGASTAVVIGVGFTAFGLHQRANSAPADVPLAAAAPGRGAGGLVDDAATATAGPDVTPSILPLSPTPPTPSPSAPASPSTRPVTPKTTHASAKPSKKPTKKVAPADTGSAILDAVLTDINQARADAGLNALTIDADLSKASALHNQLMMGSCGLSHQCPGEDSIGPRFSAQGVQWSTAGENIGFGSSGSSDSAIIGAANGLTASMLAEKPPNDGHRKNLLNGAFKRIGLSVVRDSDGKTWMVQDFVG